MLTTETLPSIPRSVFALQASLASLVAETGDVSGELATAARFTPEVADRLLTELAEARVQTEVVARELAETEKTVRLWAAQFAFQVAA